jgi:hypothetical protein
MLAFFGFYLFAFARLLSAFQPQPPLQTPTPPQSHTPAQAQTLSDQRCSPKNTAFQAGEKVTFKIAFKWGALWLSAGEVTFNTEAAKYNNKDVYHTTGFGETYKSYDWFFKVRDKYESYIDQETLQPYKFIRDVNEGGYTFYQNVTFKHDENKAISLTGTYDIPDCCQDILSAIYFSRCIDFNKLKVNDTVPLTTFLDDKVYPLYVRYLGKQKIEVKSGTYNTFVLKPLLVQGTIFKGGEAMNVYVTDDDNRVPVLIESPILIGAIRAELHSYSGLRNPFKSKVGK